MHTPTLVCGIGFIPCSTKWDNKFKANIPAHIVNPLALAVYRDLLSVVCKEVLCQV